MFFLAEKYASIISSNRIIIDLLKVRDRHDRVVVIHVVVVEEPVVTVAVPSVVAVVTTTRPPIRAE